MRLSGFIKIYSKRITFALVMLMLLFSFLLGCAPKKNDAPLIWRVSAKDNSATLYLFGSIHAAEEDIYPFGKTITNAFESSEYLAVEADVLAYASNIKAQMEAAPYTVYMDGKTLDEDIGAELFNKVKSILEKESTGVPVEALSMLKPSAIVSLLSNVSVVKAGLSAEKGVDIYLLDLAKKSGKEILEIESVTAQLAMFDSFAPKINISLIEDALNIEQGVDELIQLYQAWLTGNEESLSKYAMEDIEFSKADIADQELIKQYVKVLMTDRNIHMADMAEQYLEESRNVFFTVGALHMVGETGIVSQLKARGYTVEQLAHE